jgi:hypothetical protein
MTPSRDRNACRPGRPRQDPVSLMPMASLKTAAHGGSVLGISDFFVHDDQVSGNSGRLRFAHWRGSAWADSPDVEREGAGLACGERRVRARREHPPSAFGASTKRWWPGSLRGRPAAARTRRVATISKAPFPRGTRCIASEARTESSLLRQVNGKRSLKGFDDVLVDLGLEDAEELKPKAPLVRPMRALGSLDQRAEISVGPARRAHGQGTAVAATRQPERDLSFADARGWPGAGRGPGQIESRQRVLAARSTRPALRCCAVAWGSPCCPHSLQLRLRLIRSERDKDRADR